MESYTVNQPVSTARWSHCEANCSETVLSSAAIHTWLRSISDTRPPRAYMQCPTADVGSPSLRRRGRSHTFSVHMTAEWMIRSDRRRPPAPRHNNATNSTAPGREYSSIVDWWLFNEWSVKHHTQQIARPRLETAGLWTGILYPSHKWGACWSLCASVWPSCVCQSLIVTTRSCVTAQSTARPACLVGLN